MGKVETPYDELTYKIIGTAMAVHTELGPGFPEEIYQRAMMIGLTEDGLSYERELLVDIQFRGQAVGNFKLDFVVARKVVVEFKAVAALASAHIQQVIAYLAASGLEVGLLFNFGAASLEYKRLFPPKAVTTSSAFHRRRSQLK